MGTPKKKTVATPPKPAPKATPANKAKPAKPARKTKPAKPAQNRARLVKIAPKLCARDARWPSPNLLWASTGDQWIHQGSVSPALAGWIHR